MPALILFFALLIGPSGAAMAQIAASDIDDRAAALELQVRSWRRWFHQHPELSNREFKTAARLAEILESMGLAPRTGIAKTGVVALIEGARPGPRVAIRADIDGLPVTEQTGLPFASKARGEYNGEAVGVMHACGHDTHMAMALGAAQILSELKSELAGSVLLIFQPAEEGAPAGESGGAPLMLEEGLFDTYRPEAIFGIHIGLGQPGGVISVRPGPFMAAVDSYRLTVRGRQTHGARPWGGVDPIVTASQIVLSLQTIVSRQLEITRQPAVLSVGRIVGGIRNNIIPDRVEMEGTIRTFDPDMRRQIHQAIERSATSIAASAGASAEFELGLGLPATVNDPALLERMMPTLVRVNGNVAPPEPQLLTEAEDFSVFAEQVPGLYLFIGAVAPGEDPAAVPGNHSPLFQVHEPNLQLGVRAFAHLVVDYLQGS